MNKTEYLISQAETMHRLYYDERKTTRQIGAHFGVSKHTVETAMRLLDFERRHTCTYGEKPTRERLEQMLFTEHMSLMQIGRELNCDPGAVKWWCREYGIDLSPFDAWSQRNAQRGYTRPDKETIEHMYNDCGVSLHVIAQEFGVSRQAIVDAFREFGIARRRSGWKAYPFPCKDGHEVRSTYEQRVDDWLTDNNIQHTYEPRLPFKNMKGDFLANGVYIEVFGVMDSKTYDERKDRKIKAYADHGLALIAINYWDFSSQKNGLWHRKLQILRG